MTPAYLASASVMASKHGIDKFSSAVIAGSRASKSCVAVLQSKLA